MKRIATNHTTLVLLISDGSHRTVQWNNGNNPDFTAVLCSMRDQMDQLVGGNEIVWAFLACGQQHQQYTANEVKELVL